MKVKFKNCVKDKGCQYCKMVWRGISLDEDRIFDVLREHEEHYEFMGWGCMLFNKKCFEVVVSDDQNPQ